MLCHLRCTNHNSIYCVLRLKWHTSVMRCVCIYMDIIILSRNRHLIQVWEYWAMFAINAIFSRFNDKSFTRFVNFESFRMCGCFICVWICLIRRWCCNNNRIVFRLGINTFFIRHVLVLKFSVLKCRGKKLIHYYVWTAIHKQQQQKRN